MSTTKATKLLGLLSIGILIGLVLTIGGPFVIPPALAGAPTLQLSTATGVSGDVVMVSGSGFSSGGGRVWFDIDQDRHMDTGLESLNSVEVTGPAFKNIEIAVPYEQSPCYYVSCMLGAHTYWIAACVPLGGCGQGNPDAKALFTVTSPAPRLTVSSPLGGFPCTNALANTKIEVSGGNFPPGVSGIVGFDTNNNGRLDESGGTGVTTSSGGDFEVALTTPAKSLGVTPSWTVIADVPGSVYGEYENDSNGGTSEATKKCTK